jgi:hypothetical protein
MIARGREWRRLARILGWREFNTVAFGGRLSQNKREELYERMRKIQREWEVRWRKDFPKSRVQQNDFPNPPEEKASGKWDPAFKILIQPLCEKGCDWRDLRVSLHRWIASGSKHFPDEEGTESPLLLTARVQAISRKCNGFAL